MGSLFKNSIFNLVYKALNVVFPLITAAYVSRVLSPAGIGEVAFAQNIVSYFVLVAGLGLINYGTKEIGKCQTNIEQYSQIYFELFIINFISTLVCTIIYYFVISFANFFINDKKLYLVVGLSLVFNFIQIDWFYQGIEKYQYIAVRSIITKIICLGALIVFVKKEEDIIPFALISVLGNGFNYFFNIIQIKKYLVFSSDILKKINIKRHIKPVIILLASTISVQLYTKIDTTMLGIFQNSKSVGYYTYAVKISDLILNLAIAVIMILLPRLSLYYYTGQTNKFKQLIEYSTEIIIFFTVPLSAGILGVANEAVIFLFGQDFSPASITVRILSVLIVIKAIGYLYGTQVLMTVNEEKKLLWSTIAGACLNICLNLLLIPRLEERGAAIASVISETVVMIIQIYCSRKYANSFIRGYKTFFKVLFGTGIMMVVIFTFDKIYPPSNLRLFFSIFIGGLVYFVIEVLLKNKIIFEFIKIIKK